MSSNELGIHRSGLTRFARALGAPSRRLLRSRARRFAVGLVLTMSIACAFWIQRHRQESLEGLPDIGHPFDVEAFRATLHVESHENAFELYKQAYLALDEDAIIYGRDPAFASRIHWRDARAPIRSMLERNRPALDLWLRGTKRPRSIVFPGGLIGLERDEKFVESAFGLRSLVALVQLEATRLETEGRYQDAWKWHSALLRSSRHLGMLGTSIERFLGNETHLVACARIEKWAENKGVSSEMIRRAIVEAEAIDKLTIPNSEVLKTEYVAILNSLDHSDELIKKYSGLEATWYPAEAAVCFLQNEPERSRRIARLMIANHLAQSDKPPALRMRPASRIPAIYREDPSASPAAHPLPAFLMADWLNATLLGRLWQPQFTLDQFREIESACHASMTVKLAETLYLRERGTPAGSVKDLVGPYLDKIPEGYQGPMLQRRRNAAERELGRRRAGARRARQPGIGI